MPKFFNSDVAELAHQLTISPRRLRVEQIRRIANLVGLIESDRAYPFDFVCYHITKYRKRGPSTGSSIPGKALISDLVSTAELISRRANLSVQELGEPYCTYKEVAAELAVSTKTIRRWRNRGLLGVRVVFDDGVNRLAFCRSAINRFVIKNEKLVAKGASFSQLSAKERGSIIERAREILAKQALKLHAVAGLISEETGRAVETIRYTLRRYNEKPGATPLFVPGSDAGLCERHLSMWRCHQADEAVESIARVFECTIEVVGQVLREVQVFKWKQLPLAHRHNELFDAPGADAIVLDAPAPPAANAPTPRIPRDTPAYLRSLYLTPLLTREQEQDLFRRYNYLKFKAARAVASLEGESATHEQVQTVSRWLGQIESIRQQIVRANLRLVVSIAKKHVGWSPNFFEVISDGNMSLLRAVENFDYARGNKFSTYASWAIMKNYARSIPEKHYHAQRYVTGQDEVLSAAADHREVCDSDSDRKRVRELIAAGLSELDHREREIVSGHFGLCGTGGSLTLEQLGRRFGVTKERIRQIERRAITRLREVLAPSLADTISD